MYEASQIFSKDAAQVVAVKFRTAVASSGQAKAWASVMAPWPGEMNAPAQATGFAR